MNAFSLPLLSLLPLLAPLPEGWLGVYLAGDRKEAVVAEVIPGSPAAQAGLQAGDVLLAVGDVATPSVETFLAAIRAQAAGARVTLKVQRNGQEKLLTARLGERPEGAAAAPPKRPTPATRERPAQPGPEAHPAEPGYLGLRVQETPQGLQVAEVLPGSPAAAAGVSVGERLVTLGGKPVRTLADLDPLLADQRAGQAVELGLQGDAGAKSLRVVLGKRGGAAAPPPPPAPPAVPAEPEARGDADLQREVQELRDELRRLRQQVEELRRAKGRE